MTLIASISSFYADDAASRGENIQAVLNADMIGWEGDGAPAIEDLDVNYNSGSQWLVQAMAVAAAVIIQAHTTIRNIFVLLFLASVAEECTSGGSGLSRHRVWNAGVVGADAIACCSSSTGR